MSAFELRTDIRLNLYSEMRRNGAKLMGIPRSKLLPFDTKEYVFLSVAETKDLIQFTTTDY